MVKLATSIIALTLLTIPALAASSQQYERSISDSDIYGRSIPGDDIVVTREDLIDIYGREFVEHIEERSPLGLGLLFKGIKAAVKIGKGVHKAHEAKDHAQNMYNNRHHRREFTDDEELALRELYGDELDERSPLGLGLLFKGVKAAVKVGEKVHKAHEAKEHVDAYNNHRHRREFDDEVYEREFDEEDMLERDFDEEDMLERDFDEEDLLEREFDDEDLLEREYFEDLD